MPASLPSADLPPEADRRRIIEPAEAIALAALGLLLIAVAMMRQNFMGDGVRHLPAAISSPVPPIGAPRWLFFPAVLWAVVHPFAAAGWITSVEAALPLFLAISVLSGIVYLWSLCLWLRADGCDGPSRTAALLVAAATTPFLILYSDVTEPQLAAAAIVAALAIARAGRGQGSCSDRTAIAVVGGIAAAALVYQGLIVAIGFIPLVVPLTTLRHRTVLLSSAALLGCVPLTMIAGRMLAGDTVAMATATTFLGEHNALMRSFMASPTPVKWVVALFAAPPQALVGLDRFAGLPALVRALGNPQTMVAAAMNVTRLAIGAVLMVAMTRAIVRTRDWRLAAAALAVMSLPILRNQQYTDVKFFVLWPAVIALVSTKIDPRRVGIVAALLFALNGSLLARDIADGRRRYSEMTNLYSGAPEGTCFFTSDWNAPFSYLWRGTTAAVIGWLATGVDSAVQSRGLTASLESCFCNASAVWTDTTAAELTPSVAYVADHFQYTTVDLPDILFRPADGSILATDPIRVYAYSRDRRAEVCRRVRALSP